MDTWSSILYLTPEGVIEYEGNYDDYLNGRQDVAEETIKPEKVVSQGALDYKERKRIESERGKIYNRFKKVESLIESNDARIAELNLEYESPDIATDYAKLTEISGNIEAINKEQEALMEEWEKLQEIIEKFER